MDTSKVYVPGMGPLGASILILGEAPAYEEVIEGKPFVGPSGRELNRLLKDVGINRNNCWITNVCKYMVPFAPKGKKIPFQVRARMAGINLEEQLYELQNEINSIRPNVILALGGTALWALSGKDKITNYRGSIMLGMGRKFVATYHPAHLLHTAGGEFKGYWNRQLMLFDMRRALAQSYFPEIVLPERTLQICRSSYELAQFIERYKQSSSISVDIEAGGHCVSICIGLSFQKNHGITIPLWNINGISNIPDSDLVQCWILLAETLATKNIIGQNFNYDRDKIRRLGFKIGPLISDTMLKSFCINPELPKRLAHNQSIYTEEPFYKDEGMYEGSIESLLIGCARDACVTKEIDEAMDKDLDELNLRKFYENFLMKLPDFYLEIEQTGFKVNPTVRDSLVAKYVAWDEKLRYELYKLTGQFINVNSNPQVKKLFEEWMGELMPGGCGEEEVTRLLNLKSFTNEIHRKVCELILEDRRVRKTNSTYMMALPDYDGRMKTTCFPCLETGRSSNGQQEPPIRPNIEVIGEDGKKKKKSMGIAFQTITKHGDIGADVRKQYEPDEGCIFVQLDSSQAEARVISLLDNDDKMLALYDTHDIHALTASWFFGNDESKYSKKELGYECPERFIGKTLRHAGERGAKGRRAMNEVNTQARKYKVPIKITENDADQALIKFHKMCPNIVNVYFKEITEIVQHTRQLTAPLPYGIDAPCGGKRMFFERWGDELLRQAFSYIPQRAVSDNTKAAGIRIKERYNDAKIVMESHDSLLFMVRINELEDFIPIAKEEMERELDFTNCSLSRRKLAIPCEVEVGYNFMELKKYKMRSELPLLENV